MTTRVWTREELDQVWPLPDGWYWRPADAGVVIWYAIRDDDDAPDGERECVVGPNENMRVHDVPARVVLAVIGAHLGHDSP